MKNVVPSSARGFQNGRRDPPPEDEGCEANQDENTGFIVGRSLSFVDPVDLNVYMWFVYLFFIRGRGDGRLPLNGLIPCVKAACFICHARGPEGTETVGNLTAYLWNK